MSQEVFEYYVRRCNSFEDAIRDLEEVVNDGNSDNFAEQFEEAVNNLIDLLHE